uniref:Uncharacterized protein n=1 Tax=Parascaris univalens TaxID=6257 RepID=A0A915AFE8_PARUN
MRGARTNSLHCNLELSSGNSQGITFLFGKNGSTCELFRIMISPLFLFDGKYIFVSSLVILFSGTYFHSFMVFFLLSFLHLHARLSRSSSRTLSLRVISWIVLRVITSRA